MGRFARQFTKLLLSLLSHAGLLNVECRVRSVEWTGILKEATPLHSALYTPHSALDWRVATVLPRALRLKRPLHRCNACNPARDAKAELNRRSQVCEILAGTGISRRKKNSQAH